MTPVENISVGNSTKMKFVGSSVWFLWSKSFVSTQSRHLDEEISNLQINIIKPSSYTAYLVEWHQMALK